MRKDGEGCFFLGCPSWPDFHLNFWRREQTRHLFRLLDDKVWSVSKWMVAEIIPHLPGRSGGPLYRWLLPQHKAYWICLFLWDVLSVCISSGEGRGKKQTKPPKKNPCFISTTWFGPGPNQVEPDLFNLPCSLLFHGRGVHGGNKSSMYKNCTFCKKDGSIWPIIAVGMPIARVRRL